MKARKLQRHVALETTPQGDVVKKKESSQAQYIDVGQPSPSWATLAGFIVLAISLVWVLALGLGMWNHDRSISAGTHKTRKQIQQQLMLRGFDWVFKRVGGLLVFMVWSVRAALKHRIHHGQQRHRIGLHVEHIWTPLSMYSVHAVLRAGVYYIHQASTTWFSQPMAVLRGLFGGSESDHIMSDHILLACTIIGGLSSEIVLVLLSVAVRLRGGRRRSVLLLKMFAVVVLILALTVCLEVYYTARYFHPPVETVVAAILGLLLFQIPILYYILPMIFQHTPAG